MKKLLLSALAILTLAGGLRAAEAEAPAEGYVEAPQASVASLWHFDELRPGAENHELERWARYQLGEVLQDLRRGHYIRARHRTDNVGRTLWDYQGYRWAARRCRTAAEDIARGSYNVADHSIRQLIHELGGNNGGGSGSVRLILQDLGQALSYLDAGQAQWARQDLGRAYQRVIRHPDQRVRLEANPIHQADGMAAQNRPYQAASVTRGVIYRLQQLGGGGGNPSDPDYSNRQEWRRDIRDLIDTIMDGNLRMAARDLTTLQRDIRQDGHDWATNRQWVQRLGYIGQNLRHGNESWCIQQLRELSRDLNY